VSEEVLFNPDLPLASIDTEEGLVEIKKLGRMRRAVYNTFYRLLKVPEPLAMFLPRPRKIHVNNSELDSFSTIVAVAKGNFSSIVGGSLVHEAAHAHQNPKLKPLNSEGERKTSERMWQSYHENPDLRFTEAIALKLRSRDLAILQETQAYILEYSLTGGSDIYPADAVVELKKNSVKDGIDLGEVTLLGIPLSRYSENGYAPMLDRIVNNVSTYLPKMDQGKKGYLNRIDSAALQIMRLLDQGMSHREIADLMRRNRESIHAANEWDYTSKKYKFLEEAVEDHAGQEQIDEDSLLKKFDEQKEQRVMRMRAIAMEELARK